MALRQSGQSFRAAKERVRETTVLKSLAPCGTAPPSSKSGQAAASVARRRGCLGIKAARRFGAACRSEQSLIAAGPNPSIEGTSTSGLRPLAAAPHVKR